MAEVAKSEIGYLDEIATLRFKVREEILRLLGEALSLANQHECCSHLGKNERRRFRRVMSLAERLAWKGWDPLCGTVRKIQRGGTDAAQEGQVQEGP